MRLRPEQGTTAMFDSYRAQLRDELDAIREAGTFKAERVISSPQGAAIRVPQGEVINFCANNYLGLAANPAIIAAARQALEERGFGMASVRFICGTQDLHKDLERTISRFHGTDDTILYSSCFDANGGLFETILDATRIISITQPASIIDVQGARPTPYANSNMASPRDLTRPSTTGGRSHVVFHDGYLVKLAEICDSPSMKR
jgi:glycine C-acetyltransferase